MYFKSSDNETTKTTGLILNNLEFIKATQNNLQLNGAVNSDGYIYGHN